LDLNSRGEITGGVFYQNSARIDMLWIPLHPKPSGQPGHERGNPHIDVETILGIWRDSVPEETRRTWLIADPAAEDCVADAESTGLLVPVQKAGGITAEVVEVSAERGYGENRGKSAGAKVPDPIFQSLGVNGKYRRLESTRDRFPQPVRVLFWFADPTFFTASLQKKQSAPLW
jgi:hypothetical protein